MDAECLFCGRRIRRADGEWLHSDSAEPECQSVDRHAAESEYALPTY